MYVKLLKRLRKLTASTADMCSGGCGAFWIANSLTSLFLGGRNRRLQEEAYQRNEKFQLEMERARNITEDKRLQEEIAFKRRLHTLARQYRQEELTESLNARFKTDQIQHFLNYWPLEPSLANTFLKWENHTTLNVILMPSQFLPKKRFGEPNDSDINIFKELEYVIKNCDEQCIGDIDFHQDAALKSDINGGNAAVMNIHFLMNQLPTLVIYPYYDNLKMNFNAAVWEAQAARPLMRSLFSFDFDPYVAEPKKDCLNEDYLNKIKDLYHTSVAVITGAVRDSYALLTQGKEPTMPQWLNDNNHTKMKQVVQEMPDIKQFITQEYDSIVTALDYEKNPKLLDIFDKTEIESIKSKVKSNPLKL